jgi:hypothetical protein
MVKYICDLCHQEIENEPVYEIHQLSQYSQKDVVDPTHIHWNCIVAYVDQGKGLTGNTKPGRVIAPEQDREAR